MKIYDKFKALDSLFELEVIPNVRRGLRYEKLVLTGNSDINDYGAGYLNISLFTSYNYTSKNYQLRCVFNSIDDTDFGGWSKEMSFDEVEDLKIRIAYRVLKDLRILPSVDKINMLLLPYGMYVNYE